jgi:hypothetical protein
LDKKTGGEKFGGKTGEKKIWRKKQYGNLRSDAEKVGRWVGTKDSKERTTSNSMVPPQHQLSPDSLQAL